MNPHKAALVIVAAGTGTRLGAGHRKALVSLAGEPLVLHALRRLLPRRELDPVVVVGHSDDRETLQALTDSLPRPVLVVNGGGHRQESVACGLAAVSQGGPELVLVHDAARPFVPLDSVAPLLDAAASHGCAVLAVPVADTLKLELPDAPGRVARTVPRTGMWAAQTPQACRVAELQTLLERAAADGRFLSDEAGLFEQAGRDVVLVPGSHENFKITTMEDLRLAEAVLSRQAEGFRA